MILRLAAPLVLCSALVACSSGQASACSATPAQTEGPYYKAGPPKRASFVRKGTKGRRLVVTGRVLNASCRAVKGARVDFWQANAAGSYDNTGYRFRGYQLTDAKGRYRLSTVVPGEYPGRTRHIHVKVTPPGGSTLTTQLYLPGVHRNQSDPIYTSRTVVKLSRKKPTWRARFTFVVG